MTVDLAKLQLSSANSSNKVILQGSGTFSVAALPGAGETFGTASVPHPYGSDNLLYQVSTNGGSVDGIVLPWSSGDNRIIMYARVDSSNLYIYCISSDTGGLGAPARTITYFYRLLAP